MEIQPLFFRDVEADTPKRRPEPEETPVEPPQRRAEPKETPAKPPKRRAEPGDILVENLADGVINVLSARHPKPREIPVEDLANGIVNALGAGLGVVIDTTLSTGSLIKSGVRAGARKTVSGTAAGVERLSRFVGGLTDKGIGFCKKTVN